MNRIVRNALNQCSIWNKMVVERNAVYGGPKGILHLNPA